MAQLQPVGGWNCSISTDRLPPTSMSFGCGFSDGYARNNKAKSSKNMRCFPDCCHNGHISNGFCGQDVVISVPKSAVDPQYHALLADPSRAFAVAQFSPICQEGACSISVGQTVPVSSVEPMIFGSGGENDMQHYYRGGLSSPSPDSLTVSIKPLRARSWRCVWSICVLRCALCALRSCSHSRSVCSLFQIRLVDAELQSRPQGHALLPVPPVHESRGRPAPAGIHIGQFSVYVNQHEVVPGQEDQSGNRRCCCRSGRRRGGG